MRRYTSEEIEAIVNLAAKMQSEFQEQASLEDIERMATEFGIEPQFVHLAAQKLEKPEPASVIPERVEGDLQVPFVVLVSLYCLSLFPSVAIVRGFWVPWGMFWPAATCFLLFAVGLSFPVRKLLRLMMVPILATGGLAVLFTIATLLGLEPGRWGGSWFEDLAICIGIQLLIAAVGFAISRFVELMLRDRSRGIAIGR